MRQTKEIDMTIADGINKGLGYGGIYRLEGDILTMNLIGIQKFAQSGRPTVFVSRTGSESHLYSLRREQR